MKVLLSLPFLVAAGLFLFYLLFGFVLVDPLAKKVLPWIGEEKLASRLSVEKVEFNPLTLEASVHGLALAEKSGKPLAGFERLYLNLESSGLMRFAWRVRDVQLSGPRAHVEVRPGGRLNWQALIDKLNEDKEPPKDTMPRVLIERIKIENGHVDYTDANRAGEPFRVSLSPLGIELDGLSTLPEDRGHYLLAAKLPEQGGTLKWKGDVSLNPVKSDGEVALEGVSLPNLLRVIKTPRNFELPSGTLGAGMRYRFALVKDTTAGAKQGPTPPDRPWLQIDGANLLVQKLALAPRGGGNPVFELAEARLENAGLDLFKRVVNVAAVRLAGGRVAATREANGKLDWQTLLAIADDAPPPPPKAPAKPPRAAGEALAWKIGVHNIQFSDWSARFTDRGFAVPLRVEAGGFELNGKLEGEVGDKVAIAVGPVNSRLGPVRIFSGAEGVAQLDQVRLINANFAVAEKKLGIDAVELSGVKTAVALDRNRQLNWQAILARHAPTPVARPATSDSGAPGLDLSLASLLVDGIEVQISDATPPTPVRLDLVNGRVQLRDLSLDLAKAVPLEVSLAVKQGGNVRASGNVAPGKPSGKLKLKLSSLAFKPFAPYVNQFARLKLMSGALSSAGRLNFAQAGEAMRLDYDGDFAVANLAITEEDTDEAFLGWERLASDSLEFRLAPNRLYMSELVAVKPFGKVIIFEDKTLNLTRILRTGDAGKPGASAEVKAEIQAPAAAAAAPAREKSSDSKAAFPLAIERLRIEEANAEFADLSLTPQFGTRMHALSGVVTGLSTDPATVALVELDGKVDEYGSARVRGSIQPFRATDFTDLKLTFRNLEMANLTPYSGKFAGRKIDSGRLSVDLEYKIKNRQLAGENKFIVNKLKLGERVDSPDAMKLPLDLAIALLEDSNGVIDLDLPVSGSLDDPQFSYGKIIWKAIVNVLTKLVTAPFRALGSLLGIGAEKLEAVEFDFGSTALAPPEQEKLKHIAEAFAKRPALTLTVEPAYEVKGDTRAIQEQWIRRDVANYMGLKLEPGKAPGPVDLTNPRAQKAVEALYDARFSKKGGLKAIKKEFDKPKEGTRAIHAEMLERLTLQIPVTESELQRLAQERGVAIKAELVDAGKVDAARVSVAPPVRKDDGAKLVAARMSLGAGKRVASEPPPAETPMGAAPVSTP